MEVSSEATTDDAVGQDEENGRPRKRKKSTAVEVRGRSEK